MKRGGWSRLISTCYRPWRAASTRAFFWVVVCCQPVALGSEWQGPVPLGNTGFEFLQSGREAGSMPVPERMVRGGVLPLLDPSASAARLHPELTGIVLRDARTGRDLDWQDARAVIAQALVADTWLEPGYPSDALRYVQAADGANFALPQVFDAWYRGASRRWIEDASTRQRLYRDAFLLSFANDRLRERLDGDDALRQSVQVAEGWLAGLSDVKNTAETLEVGVRTYAGIQRTLQQNVQVLDLGQGASALQSTGDVAQNVHEQVTGRFARSGQALTVLNVALSAVSAGMDEHARAALLALAFEDARSLVLIEDLLTLLRSDSATDPAMIAGLEDARAEMARFAESRLTQVASTLRAAARAGGTAASLALVGVQVGKVATPAALAFAEAVNLYSATQDFQEPLLATLVTLDRFLMGRVEALVSNGAVGTVRASDVDVPGLVAFQQQLGYQVIDVLYEALWEGRLSFSLIGLQRALIFGIKDWRNKPLKGDIEQLRERHYRRVAKNHALQAERLRLLDDIRRIYGQRPAASPTPRDDRAIVAIVDSSGSMRRTDPHNLRTAALNLLLDSLGERTRFGLVEFSSQARVVAPVQVLGTYDGSVRGSLRAAVDRLSVGGTTDIRGGLVSALEIARAAGVTPVLVLMSDGEDNVTHWRGEADFIPAGVVVHSIAFSHEADPEALARVSAATGGLAEIALTGADLQRIFGNLFGEVAGDEVMLFAEGRVRPGESVAHRVWLEAGQGVTEFRVTWPGSNIDLRLTAPDGTVHTSASAVQGGYGVERSTYDLIRLRHPQPGEWQAEVIGRQVAAEGTPYTLRVAAQEMALQTAWETNMTVPETGQPYTFDLTGGGVRWERADVRVWQPDGQEQAQAVTLGGLGALLGGASGQTIFRLVPTQQGTYRVQILAHGNDTRGQAVMRALDRSFRVVAPGQGVGRGTDIDPFIRRGVR